MKRIIAIITGMMLLAVMALFTAANIKIVNEARKIEEKNKVASYAYDNNNTISEKTNSAPLVTEKLNAESIDFVDNVWIAYFENTYFGTLEIDFPEELKDDCKAKRLL